ncbi:MAG: beta-galactosidase trimerization domain-containing protein [Chloroflexi bacterium]|nr:beta-galactosidase trimerization domain-containing protein [Chloroflexota bacterium]
MSTWYNTSFRKLFFDFHSPGTTEGLAAAFDAERWIARMQAANATAVSVFTKCGYGYSFYQKGHIRYKHPHLPEGMDMLGEQIEALHKRGMRAIGYYHTFASEPIAAAHPDWIECDAEGKPRGINICMLSPLLSDWMLPHIEEIVTLYDVDAMFFDGTYAHSVCTCPACQARFAQASGGLAISKDKTDPNWGRYLAWKIEALKEVRQAVCDVIHKHRPDMPVSFNYAYTPRMPEVVPPGIGSLMADIFPEDQVFNGSYFSAYWATQGVPFDIMNSAFLQWWGDWGCKPAIAMQQEVATAIAHGGLTWIGYQMTQAYDVPQAAIDEMGKTLAFVKEREPALAGATPVPHVAVLHSTSSQYAADEQGFWLDEKTLRGAHRLLTESMIPYHIAHEQHVLEHLPEYRAVIVPDQKYLSAQMVDALTAWVKAGGVLIATARTGTLDDQLQPSGKFALENLLGVRYEGCYDQTHAYIEITDPHLKPGTLDMPHLVEAPFVFAAPVADDVRTLAKLRRIYLRSDGKLLLRWSPVGEDSGYPAITLRRVGKGWAVYIAGEVFHAYQVKNQWNLKHIVANLLRLTIPDPLVSVDAPAWLEVVLMRQTADRAPHASQRDRLLVHLVNQHGDRAVDGNNYCLEQIVPVRDVVVRVRTPGRPNGVTLEPDGAVPQWSYANGVVTVQVPEVAIHRIVALD